MALAMLDPSSRLYTRWTRSKRKQSRLWPQEWHKGYAYIVSSKKEFAMIPTQQDMQQQKEALAALKEEISRLDPQRQSIRKQLQMPEQE